MIFTNDLGNHINPTAIRSWVNQIVERHRLKKITPHGLDTAHASLLFEAGANIKEVQQRLGHSDVETTMNIYVHVTDQAKEQTVDRFADYMK